MTKMLEIPISEDARKDLLDSLVSREIISGSNLGYMLSNTFQIGFSLYVYLLVKDCLTRSGYTEMAINLFFSSLSNNSVFAKIIDETVSCFESCGAFSRTQLMFVVANIMITLVEDFGKAKRFTIM